MRNWLQRTGMAALILVLLGFAPASAQTLGELIEDMGDRPLPDPPWKVYDFPVLTMPTGASSVTVDGVIDFDKEWRDAVVLSGFFQKDLNSIAPSRTQLRFCFKVDEEYVYAALHMPLFPKGSSLRAFEKGHDQADGIRTGDWAALEILPVSTRARSTLRMSGHFTFLWNSLGALADIHSNFKPGLDDVGWQSGAKLANTVADDVWQCELRIPLNRFCNGHMETYAKVPPEPGTFWSLGVARVFGKKGSNLFTTWDNNKLVFMHDKFDAQLALWRKKPVVKFCDKCVVVQLHSLGNPPDGLVATDLRFFNPDKVPHTLTVTACILDSEGERMWGEERTVEVGPGASEVCPPMKSEPKIEGRGSVLYLKVVQDGKRVLYLSPPIRLFRFDELLKQQYIKSLKVLREQEHAP